MSYYQVGMMTPASNDNYEYLPGAEMVLSGMRRGVPSLYDIGASPRILVGAEDGAMKWLQGVILDLVHLLLLIGGGALLLSAIGRL